MNFKINLLSKNIELTEPIRDYVLKKITNLEKLLGKISEKGGEVLANFEVAKTTMHHRSGDFFRAECKINIDGEEFYSAVERDDLYAAIDEVKELLFRKIRQSKSKKRALLERGGRSIKALLRNINPWKR